jgi:hypothetical protein
MRDQEYIVVPIALREDVRADLRIPVDLSSAEAEKIARVVLAYASPTTRGDGDGDG